MFSEAPLPPPPAPKPKNHNSPTPPPLADATSDIGELFKSARSPIIVSVFAARGPLFAVLRRAMRWISRMDGLVIHRKSHGRALATKGEIGFVSHLRDSNCCRQGAMRWIGLTGD